MKSVFWSRWPKLAHPEEYGGHSLRAGFVTKALSNGASERQVMRQTGHKSTAMFHRYSREDQRELAARPAEWMPWNYRETLARTMSLPDAV
jgi:integrase